MSHEHCSSIYHNIQSVKCWVWNLWSLVFGGGCSGSEALRFSSRFRVSHRKDLRPAVKVRDYDAFEDSSRICARGGRGVHWRLAPSGKTGLIITVRTLITTLWSTRGVFRHLYTRPLTQSGILWTFTQFWTLQQKRAFVTTTRVFCGVNAHKGTSGQAGSRW